MSTVERATIDDLLEGWIDRVDGVFVSKFMESTLDWEKDFDIEDVGFVGKMVSAMKLDKYYSNRDLINIKAFAFSRHTLQGMGINTARYPLHINKESDDSYTDGNKITVSDKVLHSEVYGKDSLKVMDVFLGITIHEGCHILHTKFKDYNDYLVAKGLRSDKLFTTLFNIIEDERIEREHLKDFKGNGNFIAAMKEHYFNIMHEKSDKEILDKDLSTFMSLLFQLIRYPKYLEEKALDMYSDILFSVREDLLPYPETFEQCLVATEEVYFKIKEYFEIEDPKESEEVAKAVGDLEDAREEVLGRKVSPTAPKDELAPGKSHYEKVVDGEYSYTDEGVKVIASPSHKKNYLELLEPLKKYIPGFKHFLFYNTYVKNRDLVGLRSGHLDTNKLVEGSMGVPSIYRRRIKETKERLCVVLLLDLSGSMGGSRITKARECAILLCEVFEQNKKADLFIYGYTGQDLTADDPELYEFYTPTNRDKTRLVNIRALCQNLDGFSLLHTRKEVRKHTNSEVLMFMISDGAPYGHGYSGDAAKKHTKEAVTKLERDKFKVVHIAIENEGLPEVYKNIIKLDNVSNLARDLYLLVKRVLK